MKVDGLGVILAIILLPIVLVVTYYIQLQVDTIAKENSYNTKLLNATYDAMSAFELNTANEELSSVADSMRSIVLASNNTFFNTLASNLGISNASQESLRPYVPAILYTMYDGYYIYSPAETAVVGEQLSEKEVNISADETKKLITSKNYLSVGNDGVKKGSVVGEYKYSPYFAGESEYHDASDYGKVLYKEKDENGDWKKDPFDKEIGYYTTNKEDAVMETDYILKPYTQYSARYVKYENNPNKKIDVTISYTLDNFITIEGTIGNKYYSKSGYLIKKGLVKNFYCYDGAISENLNNFNHTADCERLKSIILGENKISFCSISFYETGAGFEANPANINGNNGLRGVLGSINVKSIEEAEEYLEKAYEKYDNETDVNKKQNYLECIQNTKYEIEKYYAIAYYVNSQIFSNWVYDNLGDLTYGDIQNVDYIGDIKLKSGIIANKENIYYDFKGNSVKDLTIFKSDENPEEVNSNFNTHRIEVIKNSIKYNLNQSISAYAKMRGSVKEYSLPVLTDTEWDNVLSKISVVSFMQGWDCGLDVYNNYEIAYSSNNELTVIPNEIYYVPKDKYNTGGTDYYHRIDCPDLDNTDLISFKSNEIKYDRLIDNNGKYKYDHKNVACYTCINNNNYTSEFGDEANPSYYGRINSLSTKLKKAGYIGLGAMRQSTYKTNALAKSDGYKVINFEPGQTITNNELFAGGTSNFCFSKGKNGEIIQNHIKTLELTFSDTQYIDNDPNYIPNKVKIKIQPYGSDGTNGAYSENQLIFYGELDISNSSSNNTRTISIDLPPSTFVRHFSVEIDDSETHKFSTILRSVKYIYK